MVHEILHVAIFGDKRCVVVVRPSDETTDPTLREVFGVLFESNPNYVTVSYRYGEATRHLRCGIPCKWRQPFEICLAARQELFADLHHLRNNSIPDIVTCTDESPFATQRSWQTDSSDLLGQWIGASLAFTAPDAQGVVAYQQGTDSRVILCCKQQFGEPIPCIIGTAASAPNCKYVHHFLFQNPNIVFSRLGGSFGEVSAKLYECGIDHDSQEGTDCFIFPDLPKTRQQGRSNYLIHFSASMLRAYSTYLTRQIHTPQIVPNPEEYGKQLAILQRDSDWHPELLKTKKDAEMREKMRVYHLARLAAEEAKSNQFFLLTSSLFT